MAECPVCYDCAKEVRWWRCTHTLCTSCAARLFANNGSAPCPLCRGPGAVSRPIAVFHRGTSVWTSDCGDAIVIDMAANRATRLVLPGGARGLPLLGLAGAALLLRMHPDGKLNYLAAGLVQPAMCELFASVPGQNMSERAVRHWHRTMIKLVAGFEARTNSTTMSSFLSNVHFPGDMVEALIGALD